MIQRISASKDDDKNCINQKQYFTEVAVHRIFDPLGIYRYSYG